MVRRLQIELGGSSDDVQVACLEFIKPDLAESVSALVKRGRSRITVMPFLLGKGTHLTEDLEEEIGKALKQCPGTDIRPSASLGSDPAMADIVVDRVLAQTRALNGAVVASPRGVMLVKAGTRSEREDHQWFREFGEIVEKKLGDAFVVAVAQSHFGTPTMEEAAQQLADRGVTSMICVPYIFFPGVILTRNIEGGIEELKQSFSDIAFSVTDTLGIDDRLVSLTARRIQDVWSTSESSLSALPE
jgi:sirohydrochlorin cobaltochelatase